jgi:hypothetical protein
MCAWFSPAAPAYISATPTLEALIASGRGDVPLVQLSWQCARCGHREIDMVVTGKETVRSRGEMSRKEAAACAESDDPRRPVPETRNVAAYAKERMRGSESGYIRCCPASRSQSRSQAPDARLGLTGKETVKPW